MTEQFANKIKTTLAADYTAGAGSIVVTDATGMPATGTFRLRLSNAAGTILICTARAGTTLTVSVEQDDGNASSGTEVRLIVTAGGLLQLKADAGGGGGGGFPWWPTLVDPTVPAWTWQNQGGASVVQANKLVFLSIPSATLNIRSRLIAAPATPYTVTALMQAHYTVATANNQHAGIIFRESGTGKLYTLAHQADGTLQTLKYTNDTTFSGVGPVNAALTPRNTVGTLFWLRIADDGVNLIFSTSRDGRNFTQRGSEGRTAFMAGGPNQIGLFGIVEASAAAFDISYGSFEVA